MLQPRVDDIDQRVFLHLSWDEFSSFAVDRDQARAVRNFMAALRRN
ncbi:MAG: hypothetical protein AB1938_12350 [Myxococcota bacterium]